MNRRCLVVRRDAWATAHRLPAPFTVIAVLCLFLGTSTAAVPVFTEISDVAGLDADYAAPGVYGPGVAVMDFDGDGDLDLFVPNDLSGHKLYRNDGDGSFTDIAPQLGLDFVAELPAPEDVVNVNENDPTSMMPCFVDTDNDGDLDFFLTVWNGYCRYFENVGGEFVDRTHTSGLAAVGHTATAAWGDYNRDGHLDVYLADWGGHDRLFRNEGDHRFTDVSGPIGLYERIADAMPGWCAIWMDHDGDNWPDLYVGNDYGQPNFLYMNEGNSFVDRAPQYFPELLDGSRTIYENNASMGQALGDFDRDGDFDLFVANSLVNDLYERRGDQYHDLMEDPARVGPGGDLLTLKNNDIGWHCDWPDLDQDGWVDLFLVNGYIRLCLYDDPDNPDCSGEGQPFQPNLLWMNDGDGSFTRVTDEAGLTDLRWGKAGAFADFDDDGDLDLFVTNAGSLSAPSTHGFWRNDTEALGNWLQVDLVGRTSNRDGYGAKLRARVTEGGEEVVHMRDHWHSTGYLSQAAPYVHFGLGEVAVIDELSITWPSGHVDVLRDLPVNQRIRVVEYGTENGVPALPAPALRVSGGEREVELRWDVQVGSGFDRFLITRTREGAPGGTVAVVEAESGRGDYRWVDREVVDGGTYRYTVIAERGDFRVESASVVIDVRVLAPRLAVRPASPNPFNPRTVLAYRTTAEATRVNLRIVDARGRVVTDFVPGTPGRWQEITWDGTDAQGRPVASGSYRFVVESDGRVATTPLTLIR